MRAILSRKEAQPRDFYDVVWLMSHSIKPDSRLFLDMKIKNEKELFLKLKQDYSRKLKPNIKRFEKSLSPFLLNEEEVDWIDNFEKILQ